MFPKSVRGDDMKSWGATTEEMVGKVRGTFKENAELKARLAEFTKGVPAGEDEYTFTVPDEFREAVSTEDLKAFSAMAAKLKMPASAAQDLVTFEMNRFAAARKAYAESREARKKEVLEGLRAEYKDKTDSLIAEAQRVAQALGGKELRDELDAGMGDSPLLIRAFIKLAPQFGERGVNSGGAAPGQGAAAAGEVDLKQVYPKSYNQMTGRP
jgi:hypothetical protein